VLAAEGVRVRFGGNTALDGVDFRADAGRITGLIGPNGAGKTTLFNVMTGLQPATSGRVLLDGDDISRLKPSRRARRGLGRTFQRLELFGHLTVRENVLVAADFRRGWSRERFDPGAEADAVLARLALGGVADAKVGDLPTGLCRQVELARALAIRPRVLLLDEPASGQDESETEQLAATMTALADDGLAVVLVEHDLHLVMRVCHTISVLDLGNVITTGPPAEVREHPGVLAAYIGTDAEGAA
jgi:branched-chain amino acid transport system ATP-binding protein